MIYSIDRKYQYIKQYELFVTGKFVLNLEKTSLVSVPSTYGSESGIHTTCIYPHTVIYREDTIADGIHYSCGGNNFFKKDIEKLILENYLIDIKHI